MTWPINEHFLAKQMEDHVGRIEYILDRDKYSSLEEMALDACWETFSAMEINFLDQNAAEYGYKRVGECVGVRGRRIIRLSEFSRDVERIVGPHLKTLGLTWMRLTTALTKAAESQHGRLLRGR